MRKALAFLAFVTASLLGVSPASAQAPVCSGSYYDYQQGEEIAVGFFLDEWCYDPDGGSVTVVSIGWSLLSGTTLYGIRGNETVPITVVDDNGNQTVFYWSIIRY